MRRQFAAAALLLCLSCSAETDSTTGDFFSKPYHSYAEIEAFIHTFSREYEHISRLETIGRSVEGRGIYALIISAHPGETGAEPSVRLTGAMHGNERITAEILLRYCFYLAENYGLDSEISNIIENTSLTVIPVLNPDGLFSRSRFNSSGVDLNRNFSVAWEPSSRHGSAPFSEPESAAFRDYSMMKVFHLSATYHSGAAVVNMPFDYDSSINGVVPDEYELVQHLAGEYALNGSFLDNADLMTADYVTDGITNGGDWYVIHGSLQDWSYVENGCVDLTVEISDENPSSLEGVLEVFMYNRDSITSYIKASGIGVSGIIEDSSGAPLEGAEVWISGGDLFTRSNSAGYYKKLLLPGSYMLNAQLEGHAPFSMEVEIPPSGSLENADIILDPL